MWASSMRPRVLRAKIFQHVTVLAGVAAALVVSADLARAQCYSGSVQSYQAGQQANAVAFYTTAVGYGASALCENSVAVGTNAQATGGPGGATALGSHAQVNGANSMALGLWARAFADNAMAIGSGAYVTAEGGVALGGGANAHHINSIAIGNGVATTADNQVRLGTETQTYTLTGIASASSSAAQTGAYRYMVTSDEFGNLAVAAIAAAEATHDGAGEAAQEKAEQAQAQAQEAAVKGEQARETAGLARMEAQQAQQVAEGALQRSGGVMAGVIDMGGERITNLADPIDAGDAVNKRYVEARVGALEDKFGDINMRLDRHTEGIAMAMAMGGGVSLPHGKTFAIGANVGYYDDKQAVAAQAFLRLGDVTLNTAIGMGMGNQSNIGGRAGLMAAW